MSNPHFVLPEVKVMFHIAVCDDNELHLQHTARQIEAVYPPSEAVISLYPSGSSLLRALREAREAPDAAVLDIRMDDMDGISLAKELNLLVPNCGIIFLTAYSSYAPEAYLTRHVWFISKDRAGEFLLPALQRALHDKQRPTDEELFTLRSQGKLMLVPMRDVLYIDRIGRKTRVVCRDAQLLVSQPPASIIPAALSPYMLRCHQGYWVNFHHIVSIDHTDFILDDGTRIPTSRTYRSSARDAFFKLHRSLHNSETPVRL